jgi:hypothetical protein
MLMAAKGALTRNHSSQNLNPHLNPVNLTSDTNVTPASDCMTQLQAWANERTDRQDVLSRLRANLTRPSSELDLSLCTPLAIQALDENAMVLVARECTNAEPPVASIKLPQGMSQLPLWLAAFKQVTALELPDFKGNAKAAIDGLKEFMPSLQHADSPVNDEHGVYLQCYTALEQLAAGNRDLAPLIARLLETVNSGASELDLTSIAPDIPVERILAGPIAQLIESAAATGRGAITSIKFPRAMPALPVWVAAFTGGCEIHRADTPKNTQNTLASSTKLAHDPLSADVQEWVAEAQGDERRQREAVAACLDLCLSRTSAELDLSGCTPRAVDAIDKTLMQKIALSRDAHKAPLTSLVLPDAMQLMPDWLGHFTGVTSLVAQEFKGDQYLATRWARACLPKADAIDIRQTDWGSIHEAGVTSLRSALRPETVPLAERVLGAMTSGRGALDLSTFSQEELMAWDVADHAMKELVQSAVETGHEPVTWMKLPEGMKAVPNWLKGFAHLEHLLLPDFTGSWVDASAMKHLRLVGLGRPTHPQLAVSTHASCAIHADEGRFQRTVEPGRKATASDSLAVQLLAWEAGVPPSERHKREAISQCLRNFIAKPSYQLDLSACDINLVTSFDAKLMGQLAELPGVAVTAVKLPPCMSRLPDWLSSFARLGSVTAAEYLGDKPGSKAGLSYRTYLDLGDKALLDWQGNREILVKLGQQKPKLEPLLQLILQAAVSADGVLDLSRSPTGDMWDLDQEAPAIRKWITSAMLAGRGEIRSVVLPPVMLRVPEWLSACTELTHLGMQEFGGKALDVSNICKLRTLDLRKTEATHLMVAAPPGCKVDRDVDQRWLTLFQQDAVTVHGSNLNGIVDVEGHDGVWCEQLSEWQLDRWSRGELEPQSSLDTLPNVRRLLTEFVKSLPAQSSMRNYTAHHQVCEYGFPKFAMQSVETLGVGQSCLYYVPLPYHVMAIKITKTPAGASARFFEPNATSKVQASSYPLPEAKEFCWQEVHHKLPANFNERAADSGGRHLYFYEHCPPNPSGNAAQKTFSMKFAGAEKYWPRNSLLMACSDDLPQLIEAMLSAVTMGKLTLDKLARMVALQKGGVFGHIMRSGRSSGTLPAMFKVCELLVQNKKLRRSDLGKLIKGKLYPALVKEDLAMYRAFEAFVKQLRAAKLLPKDFKM